MKKEPSKTGRLYKPIAIVTVTYKSARYITRLLESLEHTNNHKLIEEILIIENYSDEMGSTRNAVLSYAKKSKFRIRFINAKNNNGFAKSCNFGAKLSKSEYILFLNPDTEARVESIPTLYRHTIRNKADISGGKSINHQDRRHLTVVRKPTVNIGLFEFSNLGKIFRIKKGHDDFYYLNHSDVLRDTEDRAVDALGGAFLMVKRSSYKMLGGFDEKYFMYLEDVDLSVRAGILNMKVIYCPHSVIKHVGGASSSNKNRILHKAWFASRRYYYRKHFGLLVNCLIQPIYIMEEYILRMIKGL